MVYNKSCGKGAYCECKFFFLCCTYQTRIQVDLTVECLPRYRILVIQTYALFEDENGH